MEEPYAGITARLHRGVERPVYGLRIEAPEGHFHVRLPGAEPDLADEDVAECHRLAVINGERIRAAGAGRLQQRVPVSFVVRMCGVCPCVPRSGDFYPDTRLGPSPDAGLAVALEHHAAADNRGQAYPARPGLCEAEREQQE